MDKRIKALWIESLRGGEYGQGIGRLRSRVSNNFCCLGVLCDLASKEGVGEWRSCEDNVFAMNFLTEGEGVESAFLPSAVRTWAGMSVGTSDLMDMNDSGVTFEEIADYIEESL